LNDSNVLAFRLSMPGYLICIRFSMNINAVSAMPMAIMFDMSMMKFVSKSVKPVQSMCRQYHSI